MIDNNRLAEISRRRDPAYESTVHLLTYQNALLMLVALKRYPSSAHPSFDEDFADVIRTVADGSLRSTSKLGMQYGFAPRILQEEDGTRYLVITKADASGDLVFKGKLPDDYSIGTWSEAEKILDGRGVIRLIGMPFYVPIIIFKNFEPLCYVVSVNDSITMHHTLEDAYRYVGGGWSWAVDANRWRIDNDDFMVFDTESKRMRLKKREG